MNRVKTPKMNSLLLFLVKSTLSLSLLYLAFRLLLRKETFFKLSRVVLLCMVLIAVTIPFIHSPQMFQQIKTVQLDPIFQSQPVFEDPKPTTEPSEAILPSVPAPEPIQTFTIFYKTLILYVYFSGVIVSFLILIYSIISVTLLFRKARKVSLDGIRLMIIADDMPAFSFGRYILISQHDYDTNPEAIITHERSHIRMGHFYDLLLMELAKVIFWFNPLIYRMVRDLKEIHEFQADDHTLNSGIDATQYQLLIIQKCVGHQKFALANSFNHCQIKNRITMMNKQKTSKAWRWKVATFLPLLALLLMAFGKPGENVPPEQILLSPEVFSNSTDSVKQWTEKNFNILKPKERESLVLGDEKFLEISMDAQSHITIGNDELMLSGVPAIIRKWRDYDLADDKSIFEKISVNGNEKMASVSKIIIRGDDVPYSLFKELANRIGNTVLEIRGKYSKNIFKVSYSNLSDTQRDEIDKLIPLNVYLGQINVTEVKPAPAQRR